MLNLDPQNPHLVLIALGDHVTQTLTEFPMCLNTKWQSATLTLWPDGQDQHVHTLKHKFCKHKI